ncbi:MAG: rod shape-determining protein MreD, partial [Spirochaetaceae bacterium]|nr:rod shape-determining protein MreD [Spirochaetaceae bacterium]
GLFKGQFFLDLVFLPVALCSCATLLRAILLFMLNFLFSGAVPAYSLTSPVLWVELLFNAVTAPFLFAFLKMFDGLLKKPKGI